MNVDVDTERQARWPDTRICRAEGGDARPDLRTALAVTCTDMPRRASADERALVSTPRVRG